MTPIPFARSGRTARIALLSLVLALTSSLATAPPTFAAPVEETIDGITYLANDTNVAAGATVIDYDPAGPMGTDPVIPEVVDLDGVVYDVTSIGVSAFRDHGLASVAIPDSVVDIGTSAFRDNSLANVVVPDSVVGLGNSAFQGNSLTNVTLGNSLDRVPNSAFYDNSLTHIVIPDSVASIGVAAFSLNQGMTGVTFGNALETIGNGAFNGNAITDLELPDSLVSIGTAVFNNNALTSLTLGDSLEVIGSSAFNGNGLTDVVLPDSLISIGNSAFNNNALTSLTLGESLETIGNSAFNNSELTDVVLPDSLTSIGDSAFNDNSLSEVVVPASVSSIGSSAFAGNPGLVSVTFEGDAPAISAAGSEGSFGEAAGKTVFFSEGASGFTTPTWEGYASEALVTEPPVVAPSGPVATRLRLNRRPKRDRVAPYVFRVKAVVRGEFAVSSAVCGGRVRMVVRRGKKRLARARVPVRPNCTTKAARLRITPKKLRARKLAVGQRTRATIVVRFSGTADLKGAGAKRKVFLG